MLEIGKLCYSSYCEALNFKDDKGNKLELFESLSDRQKTSWVKAGSYTVLQFAVLFNTALPTHIDELLIENPNEEPNKQLNSIVNNDTINTIEVVETKEISKKPRTKRSKPITE